MTLILWARTHPRGYEVSSRGDKRYSALHALMPDGRTIEEHYQCDVKGYDPGGTNWRLGKGRPPLQPVDTWLAYLTLWRTWTRHNPGALPELRRAMGDITVLTDCFAHTPISQARALADLLNE